MARRLGGGICLLAVLCAVGRCAASPPQPGDSDVLAGLLAVIGRSVRDAVEPLSSELSSQRALLTDIVSRLDIQDSRIDLLNARLSEQQDSINSRLDLLSARLNTVSSQSSSDSLRSILDSQLGSANERLNSIQAILESQFELINSRMDSLHSGLDTNLTSVNSHMDTLQSVLDINLTSVSSQLDSLQSRLKINLASGKFQLDSLQSVLDTHLTSVNSQLDSLQSGLDTNLTSVNSQLDFLQSRLDTNLTSVNSRLDSLQSGLKTNLTSVNSGLDSISTRLEDFVTEYQRAAQESKVVPRDCDDLPAGAGSGVYMLRPGGGYSDPVEAFCDMSTDDGGWTVLQRREDLLPRENFNRTWADYKAGFGELTREFWWGLEKLRMMTEPLDRRYELRVDLGDFDGETRYAQYQDFRVSPEDDGYRLSGSNYTGNAGDSMTYHFGQKFSTTDKDQDNSTTRICAQERGGGWWYKACYSANLNGIYLSGETEAGVQEGVAWSLWKGLHYSLKTVELKVRSIIA